MGEKYTGIVAGNQVKASDMEAALDAVIPVGAIFPYAGSAVPSNDWAICDGHTVSRNTYSKLLKAIGTTWGAGDGSTTFNLPDLRGATIRGVGTSSGFVNTLNNQPDNITVALAQRDHDAIRNMGGTIPALYTNLTDDILANDSVLRLDVVTDRMPELQAYVNKNTVRNAQLSFSASRGVPVANENKVKARGVNFIIKLI